LRKEGDRLLFDFTGTSPENETPFHQFPHHLIAAISLSIFSYSFYDLPVCTGTLAPIDVHAPEGCMLNPHPDAASSVSPPLGVVIQVLANTLLSKLMFDSDCRESSVQCNSGQGPAVCVSGVNQYGLMVTDLLAPTVHGEGQSALPYRDGTDTFGFAYSPSTAKISNAEDDEEEHPLLRLYTTQSINSCGFGKYRGGVGVETAYVIHHVPYCGVVTTATSGSKAPLQTGLFGGYPGAPCPTIHITDCDIVEMMKKGDPNIPSNKVGLLTNRIKGKYTFKGNNFMPTLLKKGEFVAATCIGGAGYGDVLERDPEAVMTDIKKGIIYEQTAKNVYCVAYDPETLEVDHEQTKELRRKEIEKRLQEGKPYEEFVKEWLQKKPREDILWPYGSWPDAAKVREIIRI
jgi:N-methylhydantoinase B/oxoprolinase/acetone carboxylase alpha subunit